MQLTRQISIPMSNAGDVLSMIQKKLSVLEGRCEKEGYIKPKSITVESYSCGQLKGNNVMVHVVFNCNVINPLPGDVLSCLVEHSTNVGITARLNSDDSPLIVFIVRNHHLDVPFFSELEEGDEIQVTVVGQRFQINDPKISIIGMVKEVVQKEVKPDDTLEFYHRSVDLAPGKGRGECGDTLYPGLGRKTNWRQQLSFHDEAEFTCDGKHFPPDSKWKTLEHYYQASRLALHDPVFANLLRVGELHGDGSGVYASKLSMGATGLHKYVVKLTDAEQLEWDAIKETIWLNGARAKFTQNEDKKNLLCATKTARLMYSVRGKPSSRLTHYETVRSELM